MAKSFDEMLRRSRAEFDKLGGTRYSQPWATGPVDGDYRTRGLTESEPDAPAQGEARAGTVNGIPFTFRK